MGFSMYMNKILIFSGISLALAGCGGTSKYLTTKYVVLATSTPTDIQETYLYSTSLYGSDNGGRSANIAVLLPMSGNTKAIGNNIKTSFFLNPDIFKPYLSSLWMISCTTPFKICE
jgi:hypothetical protein